MERQLHFEVSAEAGRVSAALRREEKSERLLLFAHGAGAGMRHVFMERSSAVLAEHAVATLRYQFPYMERGSRRPDRRSILLATVRAAAEAAAREAGDLPLYAGGKSMGGRMTSQAAAEGGLPGVRGLVFFGFPLHPAGKPSTARGDHLDAVGVPMLFLQGTRDKLADLDLLRPIVARLGERATLHIVDGADHGFHVLKRSGRSEEEVLEELARAVEIWSPHSPARGRAGAARPR